jgi:hypothetical protein
MKIIETNQKEMTLTVRKDFYEKIMAAVNSCQPFVKLDFPSNHWPVHKKLIAVELLDIFGEITTFTYNKRSNSTASVPVVEASSIPSNVDSLMIKFTNEDV